MMRASSVAESTARAVVAAVGKLRRSPRQPARSPRRSTGRKPRPCFTRAAHAGRMRSSDRSASRSRTRRIFLHLAPGSTRSLGGCRVSDESPLPRAAQSSSRLSRCCAPMALPSRPSRPPPSLRPIELFGPRSLERHPPGRACDARATSGAARGLRPLFDIHFLGSEAMSWRRAKTKRRVRLQEEGSGETSRRWPMKSTIPVRLRRAPKRWSNAALRKPPPATRCAGSRARRRRGCHGGAAIGAGARGAGHWPTCGAPCAKACATTAK